MNLSKITLQNFRSYQSAEFSFDKSLTLITGRNGSGKTNLLEAIYVLLQGNSFRVSDRDLIHEGDEWWRLDGVINSEVRQVRYQLQNHPPKQLIVHQSAKRFMFRDRLPVVLFEPTDLQLIHGSPSRRRDNLDIMLSSYSPSYKTLLGKYERALKQRNNALKSITPTLDDRLFSWDVLLSEYGVELIRQRAELIDTLNTMLSDFYGDIAGKKQAVTIVYHHDLGSKVSSSHYIHQLHTKLPVDKLRGTTSVGPHRDDIEFLLRDHDAQQTASRGEIRTILLSLKMAYAKILEDKYEQKPIILLDDVFSELDEVRQQNLLDLFLENQIVITDTKNPTTITSKIELST